MNSATLFLFGSNFSLYKLFGNYTCIKTKCKSVKHVLSCIIYQHVSVASAAIIRLSYKSTSDRQTVAQNVKLKPPHFIVNILCAAFSHKISNYVKNR